MRNKKKHSEYRNETDLKRGEDEGNMRITRDERDRDRDRDRENQDGGGRGRRTVQRPKMKRIAYKNIQISVGNGGKGRLRGRE